MTPADHPDSDAPESEVDEMPEAKPEAKIDELSSLHRMAAPQNFEDVLTETIRKRSAGRFFGPKKLADRVPFLLLAVVALVLGLLVFFVIRSSDTGSLRYQRKPSKPAVHPEAPQQMPSPYQ